MKKLFLVFAIFTLISAAYAKPNAQVIAACDYGIEIIQVLESGAKYLKIQQDDQSFFYPVETSIEYQDGFPVAARYTQDDIGIILYNIIGLSVWVIDQNVSTQLIFTAEDGEELRSESFSCHFYDDVYYEIIACGGPGVTVANNNPQVEEVIASELIIAEFLPPIFVEMIDLPIFQQ